MKRGTKENQKRSPLDTNDYNFSSNNSLTRFLLFLSMQYRYNRPWKFLSLRPRVPFVLHTMLFGKLLSILGVAVASCGLVTAAPTEIDECFLVKRGATFTQACSKDDLAAIEALLLSWSTWLASVCTRECPACSPTNPS